MTDVVTYDVVPRAGVIDLGKQVEGLVTRVVLPNIRRGEGAVQLVHQRADDQKPYLVPITEDGDKVYWIVNRLDTAYPGRGQAELQWLGVNGEVAKSVTYQTNTTRSMAEPGAVPDEPLKPYTQAVARDAQAAKNAAASAAEAARTAEANATQAGLSADNAAKSLKKLEDGIASGDFQGQDGKSAYQLAVDAGFDGTETQWLESLKGAPGDTTAADAAAAAAQKSAEDAQKNATAAQAAAQEAQKAAEASAGSAAQAVESVGGLSDDLSTLKTENTALKSETARTARSLDYLWKKSKGIIYDTETVTGAGSSVTVPSGAMDYAVLRKLGGMSRKGYQTLMDDFPGSSSQISVAKSGQYSYAIETLSDGVYRQSGNSQDVNGAAGQYTLHAKIVGSGGLIVRFRREGGTQITEVEIGGNNAVRTVNVPEDFAYINIVFLGNTSKTVPIGTRTEISNIMLEAGNTAHPWEPYADSLLDAPVDVARVSNAAGDSANAYPIPQAIRDLCPDYGQGTAESYNYIDFAAKAYYHVGSMAQDGTWTALATPEIIDLSAVWPDDDFGVLQVEAGGTIGLHYPALDDGFELAVPSETEIMVDVAKVVETDG